MCCAGGNITATPAACMVSGMSVAYADKRCNKPVELKRCGDVDECTCKGQ